MRKLLTWAYDHSTETSPKYDTLSHSLYISLSGTAIFLILCVGIRQFCLTKSSADFVLNSVAPEMGYFFLFYFVFMMGTRLYDNGPVAIYESLWACNQALLISAFGLLTHDPMYIRSAMVAISVDQLLWYIDIFGFVFAKKFYIGVARYIIWPETSKFQLCTTFHHLWFVPVCFWMIKTSFPATSFTLEVYLFSCFMSLVLAFIGRISTPKEITLAKSANDGEKESEKLKVYMNLNLSWELWKDVDIRFLAQLYNVIPSSFTPLLLSMFWNIGNFPGFLIFCLIESFL